MKKVLTLIAIAGMTAFYACGPSAEEKAAMEQKRQDSIAAAEAKKGGKPKTKAEKVEKEAK